MRLFEGTQFDVPPTCDRCQELEADCKCPPPAPVFLPPEKQRVRLRLEKRKRGKLMTVIHGLDPRESDLPALLTELKNSCGAGGTIADHDIEIQGDHLDRITSKLADIGYKITK
jgi:translation initiation factor 1